MNISSIVNWEAWHSLECIARRSNRYALGVIVVAMILALPKLSAANETASVNFVLGYKGFLHGAKYGKTTNSSAVLS